MQHRRPSRASWAAIGLLALSLTNVARLVALVRQMPLLHTLNPTIDPRVRVVIAFFWAVAFAVAGLLYWAARSRAGPPDNRRIGIGLATLVVYAVTEDVWLRVAAGTSTSMRAIILYALLGVWLVWPAVRPTIATLYAERTQSASVNNRE